LEQIAILIRPLVDGTGLKVSRSLILKLEQGRVPNWPMLGALAKIYETDVQAVTLRLVNALEFPGADDLLRPDGVVHASDELLSIKDGAAHDAVAPDLVAEEIRAVTDAFARALYDVADRLVGPVATPPRPAADRHLVGHATPRVRRPRRVG
jgi:hypothetical protein